MSSAGSDRSCWNFWPNPRTAFQGGIDRSDVTVAMSIGPLTGMLVGLERKRSDLPLAVTLLTVLLDDPRDFSGVGWVCGQPGRPSVHCPRQPHSQDDTQRRQPGTPSAIVAPARCVQVASSRSLSPGSSIECSTVGVRPVGSGYLRPSPWLIVYPTDD